MQTSVRIIATGTADPSGLPGPTAPQLAVLCDQAGILYTKLTIADEIVIQGVGNEDAIAPSSSPTNIPVVSFDYARDRTFGLWQQLSLRSNVENIPADTTTSSALVTASLPYIYSGLLDALAVVTGRAANGSIFIDEQDTNPPVVSFSYMKGVLANEALVQTPLKAMNADRAGEMGVALTVCEQIDSPIHDAPAAATAASAAIAGSGSPLALVRVSGIGFSLTAIAAQAAPVLVQLIEDIGGTPVVRWSTQVVAAAGGFVNVWMPVNMLLNVDATLQVGIPAATNFVTATLQGNGSIGNGSPEPV